MADSSTTTQTAAEQARTGDSSPSRWHHKLAALMTVIFCFELGIFLLVFPWATDWNMNYWRALPEWAHPIWSSLYFRGAVSGLGVVNIYISFTEMSRLRRPG